MKKMTNDQFDALAKLIQLKSDTKSSQAARSVLCDNAKASDVATELEISRQAVSNAVARCRRGIELSKIVAMAR